MTACTHSVVSKTVDKSIKLAMTFACVMSWTDKAPSKKKNHITHQETDKQMNRKRILNRKP